MALPVEAVAPVLGAACGLAALASGRWLRRVAGVRSRWLATPAYAVLAAAAGVVAALSARTVVETLAYAVLGLACVALVLVDLAAMRLPDVILGPASLVLLALLAVDAGVQGSWARFGRAVAAGAVLMVLYLLLALARPSGLGLGDVKLAGLLGVFLGWWGWRETFLGLLAAFALGAACAAVLLVTRRVSRAGALPFGPWMVLGALAGAVFAGPLLG